MIEILIMSVVLGQVPSGYPVSEPIKKVRVESDEDKEARLERYRERRQMLDDGKSQRLREEWLSQWIVSNQNIGTSSVYEQRRKLEALSTKEVLNIEKEINRRKRLYASQLAKYNRAARARYNYYHRPVPYFYWRYGCN